MHILVIEDDLAVSHSIQLMLGSAASTVHMTDRGEEGVELAKLNAYDIMFLDLNLPDLSGYEVLQSLRTANVNSPVLILSGLASTADKVKGLGFGADDYVTKPFHKDELLARVQVVVRRSQGTAGTVVRDGDVYLNVAAKGAGAGAQSAPLTGSEYHMLELLALRKGMTIWKDMS